MLYSFIHKIIGTFFIMQSIVMIISVYTDIKVLQPILYVEAIILFIVSNFMVYKKKWFLYILTTTIAISILLAEYFAFFKPYYRFIIYIPLIIGFIFLLTNKNKTPHKE